MCHLGFLDVIKLHFEMIEIHICFFFSLVHVKKWAWQLSGRECFSPLLLFIQWWYTRTGSWPLCTFFLIISLEIKGLYIFFLSVSAVQPCCQLVHIWPKYVVLLCMACHLYIVSPGTLWGKYIAQLSGFSRKWANENQGEKIQFKADSILISNPGKFIFLGISQAFFNQHKGIFGDAKSRMRTFQLLFFCQLYIAMLTLESGLFFFWGVGAFSSLIRFTPSRSVAL